MKTLIRRLLKHDDDSNAELRDKNRENSRHVDKLIQETIKAINEFNDKRDERHG